MGAAIQEMVNFMVQNGISLCRSSSDRCARRRAPQGPEGQRSVMAHRHGLHRFLKKESLAGAVVAGQVERGIRSQPRAPCALRAAAHLGP
jgi:hypothetical protein